MKVCINGNKKQKPLKIFLLRTKSLCMNQQGMELYKVCISHNPGMAMAYFTARLTYVAYAFEPGGQLVKCNINGEKLAGSMQMKRRFLFMKNILSLGVVCPCPGAINM